ncbi:hypothetical protein PLICRDRAFT_212260 [Plicaturopsis crispa FD-325 SS-3]|nr:hypothetical protein PLICRDRAFT_212260 [Plicaturopsis crispa FD-325 SS-3]
MFMQWPPSYIFSGRTTRIRSDGRKRHTFAGKGKRHNAVVAVPQMQRDKRRIVSKCRSLPTSPASSHPNVVAQIRLCVRGPPARLHTVRVRRRSENSLGRLGGKNAPRSRTSYPEVGLMQITSDPKARLESCSWLVADVRPVKSYSIDASYARFSR